MLIGPLCKSNKNFSINLHSAPDKLMALNLLQNFLGMECFFQCLPDFFILPKPRETLRLLRFDDGLPESIWDFFKFTNQGWGRICSIVFHGKKPEPNRTELKRTEPNRTEPNRTEPNRTKPNNRTQPNRTGTTEPIQTNRTEPNQRELSRIELNAPCCLGATQFKILGAEEIGVLACLLMSHSAGKARAMLSYVF